MDDDAPTNENNERKNDDENSGLFIDIGVENLDEREMHDFVFTEFSDYLYDKYSVKPKRTKEETRVLFRKHAWHVIDGVYNFFWGMVMHYSGGKTSNFLWKMPPMPVYEEDYKARTEADLRSETRLSPERILQIAQEMLDDYNERFESDLSGHRFFKKIFASCVMDFIDFPSNFFRELEVWSYWDYVELKEIFYSLDYYEKQEELKNTKKDK